MRAFRLVVKYLFSFIKKTLFARKNPKTYVVKEPVDLEKELENTLKQLNLTDTEIKYALFERNKRFNKDD